MKIYLDTCCLNRPFDDRSQARVNIEAEAVRSILERCEQGDGQLASSDTLAFEVAQTTSEERRAMLHEGLAIASERVTIESVEQRAVELEKFGLQPLDAAHLASAESAKVDWFCTCDDRLLKKCSSIPTLSFRVGLPQDLIKEWVL